MPPQEAGASDLDVEVVRVKTTEPEWDFIAAH